MRSTLKPSRRLARPAVALLLALVTVLPAGLLSDGTPARAAVTIRPRVEGIAPLSKEVYGYLPYWRIDSGTVDRLQYELVSTIAIFGLGIKADGNLDTSWVGYQEYLGDDVAAITNAAHDKGVRVVPTFQLFDSGSLLKMRAFLASTSAQTRFIGQALDLMAARQADGANLDFEPMFAEDTPSYLAFVARFRTAMQARIPGAHLVNATSAGAGKDLILGLVPLVDRQMIMTYGYRNSASTVTGAIAPLDNTTRTVKAHIERILQWAPANSRFVAPQCDRQFKFQGVESCPFSGRETCSRRAAPVRSGGRWRCHKGLPWRPPRAAITHLQPSRITGNPAAGQKKTVSVSTPTVESSTRDSLRGARRACAGVGRMVQTRSGLLDSRYWHDAPPPNARRELRLRVAIASALRLERRPRG